MKDLVNADIALRASDKRDCLTDHEKREAIGRGITKTKNRELFVDYLVSKCKEQLVSAEYFDWFKSSNRAQLWLYPQILVLFNHKNPQCDLNPQPLALTPREDLFDRIVLMLDLLALPHSEKQNFIAMARTAWGQTLERSKPIEKWLMADCPQQWVWTWEYVRELIYLTAWPYDRPKEIEDPYSFWTQKVLAAAALPQPINAEECRLSVLATVDAMSANNHAECELFILNMKKNWSQKKYIDSGKAKKNLPLTETALAQLEFIAKKSQMKPSDLAEKLIKEEYLRQDGPPEPPSKEKQVRKRKIRHPVGLLIDAV